MVYRIDVRTAAPDGRHKPASDPLGEAVRRQMAELGADVGPVQTRRIFLIDTDAPRAAIEQAAAALLADPIVECAEVVEAPAADPGSRIEIHLKPGVMDPVAASTQMALRDLGVPVREVRTGRAYLIGRRIARDELGRLAERVLANGVIESVHFDTYLPQKFEGARPAGMEVKYVPLRGLGDDQLSRLSREGHLFLSLAEMKAIQAYFVSQEREPTDIELETLAQTWSEHCVHKTLKSAVDVEVRDEAGKVIATRRYGNLIRDTIFASTRELMERDAAAPGGPFCLSVFSDNAGVIAFDDADAVCFKAETHNHPSAIEPYGGSATGVGGVIRDILGTGLGAKPVANTDVFCVARPDYGAAAGENLPRGVIHPKRVLRQVVMGVRDYGNRMGIPTVNGAVCFDDRYLGNPLVFCGCVGLIPRDKVRKKTLPGDAIVVMGGRTGRDGIHGATFSSAELTDTHADEFSHAVQIGNAITEKQAADVILTARDHGLFTAITDCGAGGLSSAIGEMGEETGAVVWLDKAPLKYAGLRYDEIWISEAQERMVLSAPPEKLDELLALAAGEDVEASVIGTFGTEGSELVLQYGGQDVGRLSMEFLHKGIPMPTRKAVIGPRRGALFPPLPSGQSWGEGDCDRTSLTARTHPQAGGEGKARLLGLLAHPNIASKHWIIRQYDHEVQGGSVIKALVGPLQRGPSDAAVIRPKLGTHRGVAIGCGLCPQIPDPYAMALAAIDEAVRNVVAVGADLARTAILDNFCWPSVDDEETMGSLVLACEACRDAAIAYGIPFISGKDSLHNQFTNAETGEVLRIPNTLLISAISVIEDVRRCITMDLKRPESVLAVVGARSAEPIDRATLHRALAAAIGKGLLLSCHDCSEGGIAVAAAEMCIASDLGLDLTVSTLEAAYSEEPARYLIEYDRAVTAELTAAVGAYLQPLGEVRREPRLRLLIGAVETIVTVDELAASWRGTLDW